MGRSGFVSVFLAFSGLSGCVTSTPVVGPDGSEHLLVRCVDSEDCYSKAQDACGGPYELVDSGNRAAGAASVHEMLVRCRGSTAGAEAASSGGGSPVSAPKAPKPAEDAPTDAAGFTFGDSVDAARVACEKTSHEWKGEKSIFRCNGTPVDTGLDASARLTFCEDELCRIEVSVPGESAAADRIEKIITALQKNYGDPTDHDVSYGPDCTGAALPQCVARGDAHFWYEWRWTGKKKVSLSLGRRKPRANGQSENDAIAATIRIRYDDGRNPRLAPEERSSADALRKGEVHGL